MIFYKVAQIENIIHFVPLHLQTRESMNNRLSWTRKLLLLHSFITLNTVNCNTKSFYCGLGEYSNLSLFNALEISYLLKINHNLPYASIPWWLTIGFSFFSGRLFTLLQGVSVWFNALLSHFTLLTTLIVWIKSNYCQIVCQTKNRRAKGKSVRLVFCALGCRFNRP